ncbi:MAG: META domain-containing protein [Flavobacteriaceae bacterium]|nr:META domain-containing protein [Flavobacteriaceae bacterium]
MKLQVGIVVIFAVLMSSCNCVKKEQKDFENGIWQLEKMQGKSIKSLKVEQNIQLALNKKEMKFSGNDGCNNVFGELKKYTEKELKFGSIYSTMMACSDMEVSQQFQKLLEKVRFYTMANEKLLLKDENLEVILTFRQK